MSKGKLCRENSYYICYLLFGTDVSLLRNLNNCSIECLENTVLFLVEKSQTRQLQKCTMYNIFSICCAHLNWFSLYLQEIPFRHIWSGNQSGLHCSFALEHADRQQYHLSCNIHVFQKALLPNRQLLQISCNLKEVRNFCYQSCDTLIHIWLKYPKILAFRFAVLDLQADHTHTQTHKHTHTHTHTQTTQKVQ